MKGAPIGSSSRIIPPTRIALIHDWLDTWGGGENVLAALLALYPEAELFALVDFLSEAHRARLGHAAGSHVVHPAAPVCAAALPEVFFADAAGCRTIRLVALRAGDLQLALGRQGRSHQPSPAAHLPVLFAGALCLGPAAAISRADRARPRACSAGWRAASWPDSGAGICAPRPASIALSRSRNTLPSAYATAIAATPTSSIRRSTFPPSKATTRRGNRSISPCRAWSRTSGSTCW